MANASFAPLRHRSFALALTSSFVSSTGTWMQSVALGVYLTETTHNPVWLGILMVAGWTPAIIGSPLGGVVADRWNRQRWIQLNNVIMTLTASSLAVLELTHHLTPALACDQAIIEGLSSAASWAAWQSLLRDLVAKDEVLAAVSLSSAQFNLGRIVGPMLAGIALALGSPGWCFALNAASFAFVVVVFAFVRSAPRERPTTTVRFFAETRHGMVTAWRTPGCRNPIIGVGVVALLASPFIALVPAMAIDVLHAGKTGTSWLVTGQGVGAVIGAVSLPAVAKRTSRVAVLRGSLLTMVVAEVLYGVAPTLATSVASLVLLGGAYVGTLTGLNTAVQLHAPQRERSRILALYTLSLSLFYPLGSLLQSLFAKDYGVRGVMVAAAAVLGVVAVATTAWRPSFWGEIGSAPTDGAVLLAD